MKTTDHTPLFSQHQFEEALIAKFTSNPKMAAVWRGQAQRQLIKKHGYTHRAANDLVHDCWDIWVLRECARP